MTEMLADIQARIASVDFSGFGGENGTGFGARGGGEVIAAETDAENPEAGTDAENSEADTGANSDAEIFFGGEFGSGDMRAFGSGDMFSYGNGDMFPGDEEFTGEQESIYTGEEREVIIPIGIPIMTVTVDTNTDELTAAMTAGNSENSENSENTENSGDSGNTEIPAVNITLTEKEAELTDIKVGSIVNIKYD